MRDRKYLSLVVPFLLFTACSSDSYSTFEEVLASAKVSNKNILLIISSPETCYACNLLEENILNSDQWKPRENFEYFFLSMDQEKPSEYAMGQSLMRAYGLKWYPAVVLTDPEGRPYHLGGYQEANPAEFYEMLNQRTRERVPVLTELLAKAGERSGALEALKVLKEWRVDFYYSDLKDLASRDLASRDADDPGMIIELIEYYDALENHEKADYHLARLERSWPQAWANTVVDRVIADVMANEYERFEWDQAEERLVTQLSLNPQGMTASRLFESLAELAYQKQEKERAIVHLQTAIGHAPESQCKERLTERLKYLREQDF